MLCQEYHLSHLVVIRQAELDSGSSRHASFNSVLPLNFDLSSSPRLKFGVKFICGSERASACSQLKLLCRLMSSPLFTGMITASITARLQTETQKYVCFDCRFPEKGTYTGTLFIKYRYSSFPKRLLFSVRWRRCSTAVPSYFLFIRRARIAFCAWSLFSA